MKVITIANQKGGVAKTTTALNMSAALRRAKKSVLMIDLDTQADLTDYAGVQELEYTLADVRKGAADINDCIVSAENGDIIPGYFDLAGVDLEDYKIPFNKIKKSYDYVIIDCPPEMNDKTICAIKNSDELIIPATADFYGYKSIRTIFDSVKALQEDGAKIKIAGVLVTKHNPRTVLSKKIFLDMEEITNELGIKLFKTFIREGVAVKESVLMTKDIFSYDDKSNAAVDYKNFVKEYLKGGKK